MWVASDATPESTPDEDQVLSKKRKTRSRDVNAAANMERAMLASFSPIGEPSSRRPVRLLTLKA
ncbi:hypothetical protein P3T76_000474 [Phytophthora citrophthora]|uniref:Uncharacterized protein n=1 Tax=Phytophthora citrophthora TaxID=4793 RepID=A0AAD9H0Q1_9STRA|nr:hypothetical protein P3T76_000474 [Phytophthora citrophthora]